MRKIAVLLALCLALSSCMDIESRLTLRADGSGTLGLTYRISRQLADLGRTPGDTPVVPLPVEKEDFARALAGIPGLSLASFKRTQDAENVTIRAVVSFTSLEALSRVAAFGELEPRMTEGEGRRTLAVLLAKAAEEQADEDSLRMIDEAFEGRLVTWIVQVPGRIQSDFPGAKLSADGRTLSWSAPLRDLVDRREDLVLSLSWQER
jgi:hypothetical protein